jgi:hypothetical protein
MRPRRIDGSGGGNAAPAKHLPRRAAMLLLFSGLIRSDCDCAFVGSHSSLLVKRSNGMELHDRSGPGSTGDYLRNLSANNNERGGRGACDENSSEAAEPSSRVSEPMYAKENAQFPFDNVASSASSEMGRRTSEITSGFVSVAERGGSDIQSLAADAMSSVEKVTKKGTRDVRRTTLLAQRALKKNTNVLVATGRGFSDMHFFEVVSFAPKIEAAEIVKWIDSQARSGTEMVGSKAKNLVLNFTGKREYRSGDVTKELIHRVASHEVNVRDWILLLKVSATPVIIAIRSRRNSV